MCTMIGPSHVEADLLHLLNKRNVFKLMEFALVGNPEFFYSNGIEDFMSEEKGHGRI